jgi:energy-coupling factor transport system ATP-binding protein
MSVAYGELLALDAVSLSLRAGEVVALMGPNASGKSTLFRAVAGLVKPVAGSVRLDDRPAPGSVQARTAVAGLVPQDPAIALYCETVAAEISDTLRHRRAGRQNPGPVLDAWGIANFATRHPRDLSAGQQQRVAIGAMLAHEPPVWLLDEPTRGADAPAREWLARRLEAHARAGGAAIVATHDVEAAARFATRVVALEHGRVSFDLPVGEALGAGGPMPTQAARLVAGAILPEEVSIVSG